MHTPQDSRLEVLVRIEQGSATLEGDLRLPDRAGGVVLFAHGSGSSRHSPRNRAVATTLNKAGLGTLLLDLLTLDEEAVDDRTRQLRFDIPFLARRLIGAIDWLEDNPDTRDLPIGCFGASTGAGAALMAAAARPSLVRAVVSRGGRPDLAAPVLPGVKTPTLLIVGGHDGPVIDMNREALALLGGTKRLHIIPGATHLFEEPGALEEVARLATDWFTHHLTRGGRADRGQEAG